MCSTSITFFIFAAAEPRVYHPYTSFETNQFIKTDATQCSKYINTDFINHNKHKIPVRFRYS